MKITATTKILQQTLLGLMILPGAAVLGEDWPQFRGPTGSGRIERLQHPTEWSNEANVAWRASVPGTGWSSPVTTGDRLFVTSAVFENQPPPKGFQGGVSSMRTFRRNGEANRKPTSFELHCYRLSDGKHLWTQSIIDTEPAFVIHPSNTYATESPATDGNRVYCYFAAAGIVACLDLDGTLLWKRDVGKFGFGNDFGSGSSLALADGRLFLQCDNDDNSFVLAMDCESGNELWKNTRNSRTNWSTPLVWNSRVGHQLVLCGSGHVASHDPESGELIWMLENFEGSFSASPAADSDQLYFGNSGPGSSGPLVGVKAEAKGKLQFTKGQSYDWISWARSGSGPGLSSPVASDGLLYVTASQGILSCYDVVTGDRVYRERLPGARSIAASLWLAGEKLFALDESGKTFVVQTGPEFEVLAINEIDDLFWSTPAIAGNSLLLRGAETLYCIRNDQIRLSQK